MSGTTRAEAIHAFRDLVVSNVSISSLKPHQQNARTHTKKQIRQIAESIRIFGWTNPVLVDADNGIIAGHGRVEAAKLLKLPAVPVLRIDDMSEAQIRAYIIADNKLAELAGWDEEVLAKELRHRHAKAEAELGSVRDGLRAAPIQSGSDIHSRRALRAFGRPTHSSEVRLPSNLGGDQKERPYR